MAQFKRVTLSATMVEEIVPLFTVIGFKGCMSEKPFPRTGRFSFDFKNILICVMNGSPSVAGKSGTLGQKILNSEDLIGIFSTARGEYECVASVLNRNSIILLLSSEENRWESR